MWSFVVVVLSVFGQIRPDTTVGRKTPKLTTYLKQTTTSQPVALALDGAELA